MKVSIGTIIIRLVSILILLWVIGALQDPYCR
jgi:hypothetical protein